MCVCVCVREREKLCEGAAKHEDENTEEQKRGEEVGLRRKKRRKTDLLKNTERDWQRF